ncbi:SH3 domain-containing protein [Streptomyces prasinus]
MRLFKGLGVAVAATAAVFATVSPTSASTQQAAALTGTAQAETNSAASNTLLAAPVDVNAVSGSFYTDGVNIRSAPNYDASVRGLGYRSHRVTVHCGIRGPLESYWWLITNNTTGVKGYIHQNYGGPSTNPGSC